MLDDPNAQEFRLSGLSHLHCIFREGENVVCRTALAAVMKILLLPKNGVCFFSRQLKAKWRFNPWDGIFFHSFC